jgi:hypothetical protein
LFLKVHLSKDRSKDILREIRALREDLVVRIEQLEDATGIPRKNGASVHETEVSELGTGAIPDLPPPAILPGTSALAGSGPVGAPRSLSVVVRPLLDLSLARAVESSLAGTEGVESARLTSLSGDSAVIDAEVSPGVSVITALRRSLPVAFDVTDSTDSSVTIELARPAPDSPDSEAATHETDA